MPAGLTTAPLLLTTDAVGGVWRYTLDLAGELGRQGLRTVIAVLGPPPRPAQAAEARALPGAELVLTGLDLDWTAPDMGTVRRINSRLRALAALTGAGAMHLHAPALVGAARWDLPAVAVAHSCVGTWWHAVRGGALPDDLAWRAELTAEGLRHAHAVIAPTAAHAAALDEVYGFRDAAVVHNGRPATVGPGPRQRAVLAAGRLWDAGKGMAVLDAAAAGLDAPVRAAGSLRGPHGDAAALSHVVCLGALDDVAGEMAQASVFCAPALYEPFGLAVLEAAHAGCALVLSDIPSFRELWDGAAAFVPAGDAVALRAALRTTLDAPGALAAAAQARATRYTVAAMVAGTLAVHAAQGAHA